MRPLFILFFFFNCLQKTLPSLTDLPIEITCKIFDYASDNAINYDTILCYRLCNQNSENAASEYLIHCFKKRYENFPWLHQHDKDFDKDFYPEFLANNKSIKRIINLIKENETSAQEEEMRMNNPYAGESFTLVTLTDEERFYEALKKMPFDKDYFDQNLNRFKNYFYKDLKTFETPDFIKFVKSFLSTYPSKKSFLRDMITHSLNGYLKTEIMREFVDCYFKIEPNALFNFVPRFLISNYQGDHDLLNVLLEKICIDDQEYILRYVNEFFERFSGVKKLKKYEFDLTKISEEKQEKIWKFLSNSITNKKIKNLCSIIYNSILQENGFQKQSTISLLNFFLEKNNQKIKSIIPNIISSFNDFDNYKKLFFQLYSYNLLSIDKIFFVMQEIEKSKTTNPAIFYKFIGLTRELSNTDLKKYFFGILQLSEQTTASFLRLHLVNLLSSYLKNIKNTFKENLLLEYIKKYIHYIGDTDNQTYLRAPLILSCIAQLKLDDLKEILNSCEKMIKKNQDIHNPVISAIILQITENILNFHKNNEAKILLLLDQLFPFCMQKLPSFDVFQYLFDKNQYQNFTEHQVMQTINLISKTNYFSWRYINKVIYSFGSDPVFLKINGIEKTYTMGTMIDYIQETSFYQNLELLFDFINGDIELLQKFVQNISLSFENREIFFWNYILFAWFFKNNDKSKNLCLFLNQLQEQNNDLYKKTLYFMLPPTNRTFYSHNFSKNWPAEFFINTCPMDLMNALQFYLKEQDTIEAYIFTLCSSLQEKNINALFNFIYEKDRDFYIHLYGKCCKVAIQKTYNLKNLASIKAPNLIFLYYFDLYEREYLKEYFQIWHPLPQKDEDFDNTWELMILPENYSGCFNFSLKSSCELFFKIIKKSPIFLQFFLRFAKRENIIGLFEQKEIKQCYLLNYEKNAKFFIPVEKLLLQRIGKNSQHIENKTIISSLFKSTSTPVSYLYGCALVSGLLFAIFLYKNKIFNFCSKNFTICRLQKKLVQ